MGIPRFTFRRVVLLAALLLTSAAVVLVWLAAGELIAPTRREIQEYHRDWLANPRAHGMKITAFTAPTQNVPCLLVEPAVMSGPGERGKSLLQQLSGKGIPVLKYGTITGNLVMLHGRNGRKEDLLPVAERFCAAGFR